MSKSREQRRFKRFNVDGVHGNMIFSSDITILNISIDGASIQTTRRLQLDREYSLKIKFRDSMLSLRGVVVWSVLSHTEVKKTGEVVPVYKAGLRFTDVLNEKSFGLLRFIDENKTESIERRLIGVRFKVKSEEGSIIDYPYEYRIKKLSMAGMLVETEYGLPVDARYDMEIGLDKETIGLVGRIANCAEFRTDTSVTYDIGIEFVSMSDGDRDLLKEYLDALELNNKKT